MIQATNKDQREVKLNSSFVWMIAGIPGTGKSTYIENLLKTHFKN